MDQERHHEIRRKFILIIYLVFAIVMGIRIVKMSKSVAMGIIRNIPFVIIGLIIVLLYYMLYDIDLLFL